MMSSHLQLLAQRRQQLLDRSSLQRDSLQIQRLRLQHSLDTLDSAVRVFNRIRDNPGLVLGIGATIALLLPRRSWSWLRTGLRLTRGWQLAVPLLSAWLTARRR